MGLIHMILIVFVSQTILIAAASNYDPYKPNLIRSEYFQMGETNVSFCHQINSGKGIPIIMSNSTQGTYGAVQPATPLSLTPSKCSNFKCTKIPIFHPPVMASCKTIVQTLLNNSTGTFIAPPNTWVVVSHGNCASIFASSQYIIREGSSYDTVIQGFMKKMTV